MAIVKDYISKKKNIPRYISSIVISDTRLSHKNHATKQI